MWGVEQKNVTGLKGGENLLPANNLVRRAQKKKKKDPRFATET